MNVRRKIGLLEIAKLANVSLGTVDRAMHNRRGISRNTQERILSIASQLGYQPNLAARALSTGPASISVGVCIPREIRYYFDQLRDGILDEARRLEHLGLQIHYAPLERLGAGENAALAAMIDRNPRALVITPGNPEKLTPLINEAESRNIRVVCLDSDAPLSKRTTAVCVDAEAGGRMAAELLGRFVAPGSQVAVVTGTLEVEDHRDRTMGFSDLFKHICPGGQVIEIVEDHDDEREAFQKCYRMLEEKTDISGIYITTANCLPVCQAVIALNLSQKIKVLASDLFLEMKPYFDMGLVVGSIYARPFVQGRMAIRLIMEHLLRGRRLRSKYYIAPEVVLRSTLHLFRETRARRGSALSMKTGRE